MNLNTNELSFREAKEAKRLRTRLRRKLRGLIKNGANRGPNSTISKLQRVLYLYDRDDRSLAMLEKLRKLAEDKPEEAPTIWEKGELFA